MLVVNEDLTLPDEEIGFAASRGGGPGGQNVNKVATRVTLRFDVDASPTLSEEQRSAIREALGGRISRSGVLQVSSRRHRTQAANRQAARQRLAELLAQALTPERERQPTRVPRASRERRLQEKRRRGRLKQERSEPRRPPE